MNEKYQKKRAEKTIAKIQGQDVDLSAQFVGFINFEWTDAHKEDYLRWALEFNFWDEYNRHCALGRRISTQFDLFHQCYVSSCFERDGKSKNAGMICTARGLDSATSLSRLLYLLSEPLKSGWGKVKVSEQSDKW